ncbi:polysaccharide pyruvyl transferase CsaB [bacterium]|nr:polysaccharide pyruvyl transferase CsaB [bacterium]
MKPPKILLSGYFGLANLGDEAIFEAMVANFRAHCPDVDLTALVASPDRAERLGVKPIPRKQIGPVIQALRNCDLLVSGGGGLIQDSTGVGSVAYYLGLIRLAAWIGKPTFLYAQGFGPVRTPWGRRLCRWMGPCISLATFRDQESLQDFHNLIGTRVPAYVTADPALILPPCPPKELAEMLAREGLSGELSRLDGPTGRHSNSGPLVAVTVRPWPNFDLSQVAQGLQRFHNEHKARYVLLAFHPEHDLAVCQQLKEQIQAPCFLLDPHWHPSQVAGFLRCCDLIVGMRLHSLILAAGAQIPCLGLSYDPKVERFAQRAGAVPLRLEELSSQSLFTALQHLLNGRHQARRAARPKVEAMEKAAQRTTLAALALARNRSVPAAIRELNDTGDI